MIGASPRGRNVKAAGMALALAALSCGLIQGVSVYPPEATRKSPPAGIERRVLEKGDPFPAIDVGATTGPLTLDKGRRHVLVFYRGAW